MRKRWVGQALIGSVGLNAILVGLLFYIMWQESPSSCHLPYRPGTFLTPPISEETYQEMSQLSFDELIDTLEDKTRLHGGYRLRDVALGLLAAKHDLDVKSALNRPVVAKSVFEEGLMFPSLNDRDFKVLLSYLETHEAPFTPKGLFYHLPKTAKAFCVTDEYIQLETILHRLVPHCLSQAIVLRLCQEAGWNLLDQLCQEQKSKGDFTSNRAQKFLVDALYQGSRQAAYLLVVSSSGHRLDELDDSAVEIVLDQLDLRTKEADACCRYLMTSKRSRLIQELAKLYLGEVEVEMPQICEHVVQSGDSLWLIAKKHGCSINQLQQANPQAQGMLRPGMKLTLP